MYDVFLSYNRKDGALAEKLDALLVARGLRVFLDRSSLRPGIVWTTEVETALAESRSVAVLVGPSGIGPIQQHEKGWALNRETYDPSFPAIPVLFPGADPKLGFLGQHTWIDLRPGFLPDLIEALVLGIKGQAPGRDLKARTAKMFESVRPYRGLISFDEDDEPFFCGRDAAADKVMGALASRNLVAVAGASGSGKSSIVRAGLIPRLRRLRNPNATGRWVWAIETIFPKHRPLYSIAERLILLLEPDIRPLDHLKRAEDLANGLAADLKLSAVVDMALAKQSSVDRLLLVVDQFEEIYDPRVTEAERQRFIDQILDLSLSRSAAVVLTLRADFYGRVLSHRDLSDRLEGSVVNIGPMTREELRSAIVEPAKKVVLEFEEGLVDRILDDVDSEPGQLPLMEFLLEQLWERRTGNVLEHDAYKAIGGVKGAIADRADTVFKELSQAEQDAAHWALLKLVTPTNSTEDTRRRAQLDEFTPIASGVVKKLTDARLLVTTRDSAGREWVEVSHEALIREWKTLRAWVNESRSSLLAERRLEEEADTWEKNGKSDTDLLTSERKLIEAAELLKLRSDTLKPLLRDYITLSLAAARQLADNRAADAKRREEEQRRVFVLTRRFAIAASILLVFALGGVVATWYQWGVADKATKVAASEAERAKSEAARAEARLTSALNTTESFLGYVRGHIDKGVTAAAANDLLKIIDGLVAKLETSSDGSGKVGRSKLKLLWLGSDVFVAIGKSGEATERARQAKALAHELWKSNPDVSEALSALYESTYRLGVALTKTREFDEAMTQFRAARGFAEKLAELAPNNLAAQGRLAFAGIMVGNVLQARENLDSAFAEYNKTLKALLPYTDKKFAKEKRYPEIRHHQATVLHWIAEINRLKGNIATAYKQFEEVLDIRGKLDTANSTPTTKSNLASATSRLGEVLLDHGDAAKALEQFKKAEAIRAEISNGDPTNRMALNALASSPQSLGDAYRANNDLKSALTEYRRALKARKNLVANDEKNDLLKINVATTQARIGDVLALQGDKAAALTNYRDALAILQNLPPRPQEQTDGTIALRRDMFALQAKIAAVLSSQGQENEALGAYDSALATAETIVDTKPHMSRWQPSLPRAYNEAGKLLHHKRRFRDALLMYQQATKVADRLGGVLWYPGGGAEDAVESRTKLGDILVEQKAFARASEEYGKAREMLAVMLERAQGSTSIQDEITVVESKLAEARQLASNAPVDRAGADPVSPPQ